MKSRLTSACCTAIATLTLCLCGARALAEPTAQDRETARTLLLDGRKKMAAQEYSEALRLFRAAHAIMNVPTTGLDLARAEAALRLIIEARETALAVTKLPVEPNEPNVFGTARTEAAELAASLLGRIPSLTVVVNGPPSDKPPSVIVDGAQIPQATVGLPRKLNPGKHTVQVTASGFAPETREVDLAEGASHTETIELKRAPSTGTSPGAAAGTSTGTVPTASSGQAAALAAPGTATGGAGAPPPVRGREVGVPIWAWISGGLGLAASGVSVAFLIDHLDARQTVQNECPDNVCDRQRHDLESMTALRARWNRDLALSLGFGAAGLAGLGAAVFGIVARPGTDRRVGVAAVVPWAAPSTAGLSITGSF